MKYLLNLDSLLDVVGELFADEISIVVSNTKEYIYYRPSKRIDLKIRPGDPVPEGTIAYKALTARAEGFRIHQPGCVWRAVPWHGGSFP